ncbi:MAG: hypothetical protein FJX72_05275, partial [Armatimonadetes bacterium]|nr:hypothetical protein [Armatimonadota bacterium]
MQKAVLGLLLANCRVSRIADRLALEQDLVALVVLELEQLGLADALGRPTDRGAKSFASEQIEPDEESTVGWVFTDPWTGRIWPHFVTADLPFAPTEVGEDNHQYLADTRGRGGRVRAFTVLPPANKIVGDRPADTDVAGAARAHRRRVRDNQDPNGAPVPVVPRVEFIADAGEPFLLWTRCWSDSHGDWHVDDPLGGEASPRLRRQLEEKLDATPLLRAWLGRVMGGDEQDTGGVALQQK